MTVELLALALYTADQFLIHHFVCNLRGHRRTHVVRDNQFVQHTVANKKCQLFFVSSKSLQILDSAFPPSQKYPQNENRRQQWNNVPTFVNYRNL